MADSQDSDREVLTSLPRSRPVRRSAKRAARPAAAEDAAPAPQRKPAAKRGAKSRAAQGAAAGGAKASAPRTPVGKTAADATATTTPAPKARTAGARAAREQPRAAPTRKVPPAGYAAPSSRAGDAPPAGAAELISTTIQAAAELTQIGLTVGRQTLQSMLDRLPKP